MKLLSQHFRKLSNIFFIIFLKWLFLHYFAHHVKSVQQKSFTEKLLEAEPLQIFTCSKCVPLSKCPINIFSNLELLRPCQTEDNRQGVCCLDSANASSTVAAAHSFALQTDLSLLSTRSTSLKIFTITTLRNAELDAHNAVASARYIEQEIDRGFIHGSLDGAEKAHSNFFGDSPIANQLAHRGELLTHMALGLV